MENWVPRLEARAYLFGSGLIQALPCKGLKCSWRVDAAAVSNRPVERAQRELACSHRYAERPRLLVGS